VSKPAEKYVTHWDMSTNPHWVTRLENGVYQSYHYIKEAADRNTAHLNELVKLRAACAEMAGKIMSLRASEHALQSENAALRDLAAFRAAYIEHNREYCVLRDIFIYNEKDQKRWDNRVSRALARDRADIDTACKS
jgi:hypothetical protein